MFCFLILFDFQSQFFLAKQIKHWLIVIFSRWVRLFLFLFLLLFLATTFLVVLLVIFLVVLLVVFLVVFRRRFGSKSRRVGKHFLELLGGGNGVVGRHRNCQHILVAVDDEMWHSSP